MVRLLAILLVAASGCTNVAARTEVVIVVNSDLTIPDDIDSIRIDVMGPSGNIQTATAQLGAGQPLPRTLGIFNDDSRTGRLGPFEASVRGRMGALEVVTRRARFDMQRQQTLSLELDLTRSCLRHTCGLDETCENGTCRTIIVDAMELAPFTAALVEVEADAGR